MTSMSAAEGDDADEGGEQRPDQAQSLAFQKTRNQAGLVRTATAVAARVSLRHS